LSRVSIIRGFDYPGFHLSGVSIIPNISDNQGFAALLLLMKIQRVKSRQAVFRHDNNLVKNIDKYIYHLVLQSVTEFCINGSRKIVSLNGITNLISVMVLVFEVRIELSIL
jgi:hypothetical protein